MARQGGRSMTLGLLAMLGAALPSVALGEVLDKYPTVPQGWLALGGGILLGILLAAASRWTLLLTWPVLAWVFGVGLLEELYGFGMWRAVLREGGWPVVINWHLMVLASVAWPLLILIGRRQLPAASPS
jgi:hypothetical protein